MASDARSAAAAAGTGTGVCPWIRGDADADQRRNHGERRSDARPAGLRAGTDGSAGREDGHGSEWDAGFQCGDPSVSPATTGRAGAGTGDVRTSWGGRVSAAASGTTDSTDNHDPRHLYGTGPRVPALTNTIAATPRDARLPYTTTAIHQPRTTWMAGDPIRGATDARLGGTCTQPSRNGNDGWDGENLVPPATGDPAGLATTRRDGSSLAATRYSIPTDRH